MFVADALHYFAERIFKLRIAGLWVLLIFAMTLNGAMGIGQPILMLAVAALYIMVFRLWDDLADVQHDSFRHPGRWLVRSPHIASYRAFMYGLLVVLGAMIWGLSGTTNTMVFAGFSCFLGAAYKARNRQLISRNVVAAFVLVKYPLLVFLVAFDSVHPAAFIAFPAVYLVPAFDEFLSKGFPFIYLATAVCGVSVVTWFALKL